MKVMLTIIFGCLLLASIASNAEDAKGSGDWLSGGYVFTPHPVYSWGPGMVYHDYAVSDPWYRYVARPYLNTPYYSGSYYPYNIPYYALNPIYYTSYPYVSQGYASTAQSYANLGQGYTAPASGYTIRTASNSSLGTYLTDGRGMTLYHLSSDQGSYTAKCTDATCTGVWPVFYTASINVPVNLSPADFRTITVNGYKQYQQTTYKGSPLYYFYRDTMPGDVHGQGISDIYGVWSVVNPEAPNTFPAGVPYQMGVAAAATAQQPSTVTLSPSPPAYTTSTPYPSNPITGPVTSPVSGNVPVTVRYPGPGPFDVYLDGSYVGTGTDGSVSFSAPAGTHYVRVWDGNFNYEQSVLFESGVAKIINVEAV